jgi:hypothetical protein
VFYLIVVPLPLGKTPFAVKLNNNSFDVEVFSKLLAVV